MPSYTIEAHGDVRELYAVEAKDVEDAARIFAMGDLPEPYLSEASGITIYRITKDED